MDPLSLPEVVRIEVKFTTSASVLLPQREYDALRPENERELGLLACLFWSRDSDAHWVLVDQSSASVRPAIALSRQKLRSIARQSPKLDVFRLHLSRHWWTFFESNLDAALEGHEVLSQGLEERFADGTPILANTDSVLAVEHRESMGRLLSAHGESQVGLIFQDLLGYLLATIGYLRPQNNPVGVPDIILRRRPSSIADSKELPVLLSSDELARLISYCEQSHDVLLASRIANALSLRHYEGKGKRSRSHKSVRRVTKGQTS